MQHAAAAVGAGVPRAAMPQPAWAADRGTDHRHTCRSRLFSSIVYISTNLYIFSCRVHPMHRLASPPCSTDDRGTQRQYTKKVKEACLAPPARATERSSAPHVSGAQARAPVMGQDAMGHRLASCAWATRGSRAAIAHYLPPPTRACRPPPHPQPKRASSTRGSG